MQTGIHLYWIPLGAGGSGFVRWNGHAYEAVKAMAEKRPRLSLLHTALQVTLGDSAFVVETMWPRPDLDCAARGVVADGAVFTDRLSFTRVFRYEVRCWANGALPDADQALGGPRLVSDDAVRASRLLDLAQSVPRLTWGRKPPGVHDMWNSNSVISWLLVTSGVSVERLRPPAGARAPGWDAGVWIAGVQIGQVG